MKLRKSLFLAFAALLTFVIAKAQVVPPDRKDWAFLGSVNVATTPYTLLCYKILQINNATDRYASVVQVSVQADANYFNEQATYEIRIDKHEGSPPRFDGLEILCISGNPGAATFYVFNDAVWVRSTWQWGSMYWRTVGDFGNASPRVAATTSTTTVPVGALATTSNSGLKCDFDNNTFYRLPHVDPIGTMCINGTYTPSSGEESPKLAVNGNITAKKIKVTQTGWADFVFDPAYALPPLDTVETFIKQNRHLPEIPSAADVEKNGQDLGEMNKKLLQKIEELTLYVIDLKKENEAQSQAIRELQRKSRK
ncbi:hypothetical protein [Chitinophaga rhizosphaerae]|uniref:hypothetical protein n=1 Tax=Chitinophaga rhizosphaerae TaxID=1864947 RepID=UPI000F806709|nr:hypothetical protein [Chitinophaga rhizosphaerae]